ncbi:MAG: PaaI family thioesterase [Pseudomonadota bacterium]
MSELPPRPEPVFGEDELSEFFTLPGWDPYEDMTGPMYEQRGDGPERRCAMRIEARHCNTWGIVHGGLMMSFADYATFALARHALDGGGAVTVSMTSDFCASARVGDLLEAEVEVMRETRSMVFVQGREFVGDRTVLSFSAVLKKMRGQS